MLLIQRFGHISGQEMCSKLFDKFEFHIHQEGLVCSASESGHICMFEHLRLTFCNSRKPYFGRDRVYFVAFSVEFGGFNCSYLLRLTLDIRRECPVKVISHELKLIFLRVYKMFLSLWKILGLLLSSKK